MTDPLITAAQFLTTQLDWLRHATDEQGSPVAVDVFREIGECAARMRAIVDGPSEQKYLGPCGAEIEVEDDFDYTMIMTHTCDGDVYGRPGAEKGRCRTCGAEVAQDERRAWLDDVVRTYTYTAAEIGAAYPIKANTIRQWASRSLLTAHGQDREGRPLYLLGDVLDMAAGDAARREEARARRAAKTKETAA